MNTNQTISSRWKSNALQLAVYAATACLFVAPFRGATGLRAGLLVLAFLLIVLAAIANNIVSRHIVGRSTISFPGGALCSTPGTTSGNKSTTFTWLANMPPSIAFATAAWALALMIGSALSDNPIRSLSSWKGDVLTPLLALIVFYTLTRSIDDAKRWLVALFLGLSGLTGAAIFNVFVPVDALNMPAFGGVGAYSTWLITLCSLLPLAWSCWSAWPAQAEPQVEHYAPPSPTPIPQAPLLARCLTIIAMVMILGSGFLTTNRAIWICFGIMLMVFAMMSIYATPNPDTESTLPKGSGLALRWVRMIALVIVGGVVFTTLFFATSEMRFNGNPPGGGGAVEMITHDNRAVIWKEAVELIAAKPFTGYGYGRETLEEVMSARFTQPLDKALFIQGHNIVLNQLLQIGIIGAVLLIAIFANLFVVFANLLRGNIFMQTVGFCGVLLVVGVFARNMVDDFFIRQNAILFWAITGMLLALREVGKPSEHIERTQPEKHGS